MCTSDGALREEISVNDTPSPITRLSEMAVGPVYSMTADEVECTIQVLTAGPSPVCVLSGSWLNMPKSANGYAIRTIQLVGWVNFGQLSSTAASKPLELFVADLQPEDGWLVGVWYNAAADHYPIKSLACAPKIVVA